MSQQPLDEHASSALALTVISTVSLSCKIDGISEAFNGFSALNLRPYKLPSLALPFGGCALIIKTKASNKRWIYFFSYNFFLN